jgi:GNAT superfamily N-acetyltransferase
MGHRIGYIGHLSIQDTDAAGALLQAACDQLRRHGCTLAVGPMDGNTWQRYRLLTERGGEPIFFLEPDNPDTWPRLFEDNGFSPLAQYFSAATLDLNREDAGLDELAKRLEGQAIQVRTLRLDRFEEQLRRIHPLSLLSFRQNFLYTPISEDDFVAQYLGIQPYLQPELVLIADQHGQPVGYLFAIPDLLQRQRGAAIDTIIIKTLAVHPDHGGMGLGRYLTSRCHQIAHQLGYRRAIHALMHEDNRSRRISTHTAQAIRRYTLYAKPLGSPS